MISKATRIEAEEQQGLAGKKGESIAIVSNKDAHRIKQIEKKIKIIF